MNEWASTVGRIDRPQDEATRNSTPGRNYHRHAMVADSAAGDLIKCTGKSCQSCTGGLIADCVAICCCPCAVVNILAFAFLKVPWTIGKRALKLGKKKLRKKSKGIRSHFQVEGTTDSKVEGMGMGIALEKEGTSESIFEAEELKKRLSARFEEDDENLWFELYQVGHLGFGRVSFTGISSCIGQLGEQQPIG